MLLAFHASILLNKKKYYNNNHYCRHTDCEFSSELSHDIITLFASELSSLGPSSLAEYSNLGPFGSAYAEIIIHVKAILHQLHCCLKGIQIHYWQYHLSHSRHQFGLSYFDA